MSSPVEMLAALERLSADVRDRHVAAYVYSRFAATSPPWTDTGMVRRGGEAFSILAGGRDVVLRDGGRELRVV